MKKIVVGRKYYVLNRNYEMFCKATEISGIKKSFAHAFINQKPYKCIEKVDSYIRFNIPDSTGWFFSRAEEFFHVVDYQQEEMDV